MTKLKIDLNLTRRQKEAFDFLSDDTTRYLLYGGSRGGGKSFFLCWWALIHSINLCRLFKIAPSANPIPLGFLGRKQSTDFRKTTLETWKRAIPPQAYEIKKQESEIILANGACKLFFGGLDNTETINKFNSSELAFFAVDQAEETTRDDVSALRGSLRLTVNGIKPTYKELYTANPGDCWLKEDFVDTKRDGYKYIPALPSDNPHLPGDYIKTLEEAFKYSPPLLRAYRDGDWGALKSANTLLSSDDINNLKPLSFQYKDERRVVVCDPATSHDECVIYYFRNYKIEDSIILVGESDTMKIAGHLAILARKYDTKDIGGDSIGLGKGIFDRLAEMGEFRIHTINSANSSYNSQFRNLRAEVYWTLMQAVIDKRISYPEDEELRRQLINVSYEVTGSSGEIKIMDKDIIKKRIGKSPDRADCFAYGIYLSDKVMPYIPTTGKSKDRYRMSVDLDYNFNPMTV